MDEREIERARQKINRKNIEKLREREKYCKWGKRALIKSFK